jgi:hypothetical protein
MLLLLNNLPSPVSLAAFVLRKRPQALPQLGGNVRILFASGVVLLLGAGAFAQGAANQVGVSASQQTSVSASPSSGKAESHTSVRADQQTGVSTASSRQNQQKENGNQAGAAAAGQLASGTHLQVVLTKPLDASKNKPGDPVVAKTTAAVQGKSGVIIPKGAQIVGHVTRASVRGHGESQSVLGISFDRAVLKDGSEVPLNVAIQAVAAAQSAAAMNADDDSFASGSAVSSAAGAAHAGGGGLLGGVGAGAGVLSNTAAGVGGAVGNTLGSTTAATGSLAGGLSSNASGISGLPGMTLEAAGSNATEAMISSASQNVRLQSGTQMLLTSK